MILICNSVLNCMQVIHIGFIIWARQATWAGFADTYRHSQRKSIRTEWCRLTAPKRNRNITWHHGPKQSIQRSMRNSKWWCNETNWTAVESESAWPEATTTYLWAYQSEITNSHSCKLVHRCTLPLVHGHRLRKPIQVNFDFIQT